MMSEISSKNEFRPDLENKDKIERYKDMIGDSEAIFILSLSEREINAGGVKKYRPDSYSDLDNHGFMGGGHANVIAAAELGQHFPDVKLITTSAPEKAEESLAKIYAEELKRLGIPGAQINLEEKSTNTLTELIEMVKIAKKNNWESVAVLNSEVQTERALEMLNHLEELASKLKLADEEFLGAWKYFDKGKKLKVSFLEAEKILPLRDPRYKKLIEEVRESEPYKERAEAESRGAQQVREGTYGNK